MIDLNKICKRTDYIIGRHYVYEGDIIQLLLSDIKNYLYDYYMMQRFLKKLQGLI